MGRAVLDSGSTAGKDHVDGAQGSGLGDRSCWCGDLLLDLAVGDLIGQTSHDGGASAQGSESD